MLRCCAVGNITGLLNLTDRTLNGYNVTVKNTLLTYLNREFKNPNQISGRWLVYPRYRNNQWQFYILAFKNSKFIPSKKITKPIDTFKIRGCVKWVQTRQDGKLDIAVRIRQKNHNNFVLILVAPNDKYYRRQSRVIFDCRFDSQQNELIAY